jgi:hypothetical protein
MTESTALPCSIDGSIALRVKSSSGAYAVVAALPVASDVMAALAEATALTVQYS